MRIINSFTAWLISQRDYFFQASLIFLSVFLAAWVGNWNETRKEQEKQRDFIRLLKNEIALNQKSIEKSQMYHKKLKKISDSLEISSYTFSKVKKQSLNDFGGMSKIPVWNGTGIQPLSFAVYETGISSGILTNLDLDLLIRVNKMHLIEKEYMKVSENLTQKLLSITPETKMQDIFFLLGILGNDMYWFEKSLLNSYQSVDSLLTQKNLTE